MAELETVFCGIYQQIAAENGHNKKWAFASASEGGSANVGGEGNARGGVLRCIWLGRVEGRGGGAGGNGEGERKEKRTKSLTRTSSATERHADHQFTMTRRLDRQRDKKKEAQGRVSAR